jgi:hypothetical protein
LVDPQHLGEVFGRTTVGVKPLGKFVGFCHGSHFSVMQIKIQPKAKHLKGTISKWQTSTYPKGAETGCWSGWKTAR